MPSTREKTPRSAAAPRAPRRRRTPEEARALILDAAEGLFAERGPDRVSVMDVAIAAGVSQTLVLHYFKTYAELVRSVLGRRNRGVFQLIKKRLLEDAQTQGPPSEAELLGRFLDVICEPVHARLLAWAALSGEGKNLKMVENRGLARVVDMLCMVVAARRCQPSVSVAERAHIEEALLVALAAAHGYAMGKSVYAPALGHKEPGALDERFRKVLAAMIRTYLGE